MTCLAFCPVLAAIVALTNACGTVSVDTHGARVVSYVPAGREEVLFVSKTGTGGIPLCWPWFADLGPDGSQRHGLARYREFKFVGENRHSASDSELIFRLESDEETRKIFPHDFALMVSVRLNDRLTLKMTGENTGSSPFEVTEAFHPYLAVGDSSQCREEGVRSFEWRLHDPVLRRTFTFTDEGGSVRRLWYPDSQSHRSKTVSPILPGEWRKFICPENGTFTFPEIDTLELVQSYVLNPGESHTLTRTIRLPPIYNSSKLADLQARIDACSAAGGGVVRVAQGRYEDVMPIVLKDNVELRLDAGVVLQATTNYGAYAHMPGWDRGAFVSAIGATNIAITGEGRIECSGDRMPFVVRGPDRWRGIHLFQCRDVRLERFTLANAHSWGCYLQECDGVTLRGLSILNHSNHNNDGLDIASRNVTVDDCDIDSEDDALVFKNHNPDFVVENVTVRNCRLSSNTSFVKIGTETWGGFRNIRVSDCELDCRTFLSKRVGYWSAPGLRSMHTGSAGLTVAIVNGGFAEDIVYSRIRMKRGILSPVFIRLDKRNARADGKPTYLRNVTIEDVEMERPTTSYIASSITGASGLRPSDITLRRIRVRPLACKDAELANVPVPESEGAFPGCRLFECALPAYGFYLRHADRIMFESVSIEPTETDIRKPIVADDATCDCSNLAKKRCSANGFIRQ